MKQIGPDELGWKVIKCYAENDMNAWQTGKQLNLTSSGVAYHLDKVRDMTGLDPRVFFDLAEPDADCRSKENYCCHDGVSR